MKTWTWTWLALVGLLTGCTTVTPMHDSLLSQMLVALQSHEHRITTLEGGTPPVPPVTDYTPSGAITATAGQVIKKVKIEGVSGGCIKIENVDHVTVEDVILNGCGGHAVYIKNGTGHKIVNSAITPKRTKTTTDTEHGVYVVNATNVLIQGNVFKEFETGVEVAHADGSHSIKVVGNYAEKPKGPFPRGQYVQMYPCNKNGAKETRCEVTDNYFWTEEADHHHGEGMEDAVNAGSGSKHIYYARNYIEGGGGSSGCGLIVEGQGTDSAIMEDNILIATAGCGINVATAAYAHIRRNKLLGPFETIASDSAQLGIGNWYHSGDTGCHDNEVYDNVVANKLSTGSYNDIWLKSGCGTQENNTKGSTAEGQLTPKESKLPPPSAKGVAPKRWTP